MDIHFSKMHGLGNDFVVIDAIRQPISLNPDQIRTLSNRRLGVGCDQVLILEATSHPDADFRYRIFNADGNEVEQCGNGARCFAHFLRTEGLSLSDYIRVETLSGIIEMSIQDNGHVTVDMGNPILDPERIPFAAEAEALTYEVDTGEERVELSAVSMGNPHAVLVVHDIDTAEVARLGARLETHERFPSRVNVGFMQIVDTGHIRLRVYERGVGETLACGSGACAAVVAGRLRGLLDTRVNVDLPGGRLVVSWAHMQDTVTMTGPAICVFKGSIQL